jgi:hypothetical protein
MTGLFGLAMTVFPSPRLRNDGGVCGPRPARTLLLRVAGATRSAALTPSYYTAHATALWRA